MREYLIVSILIVALLFGFATKASCARSHDSINHLDTIEVAIESAICGEKYRGPEPRFDVRYWSDSIVVIGAEFPRRTWNPAGEPYYGSFFDYLTARTHLHAIQNPHFLVKDVIRNLGVSPPVALAPHSQHFIYVPLDGFDNAGYVVDAAKGTRRRLPGVEGYDLH